MPQCAFILDDWGGGDTAVRVGGVGDLAVWGIFLWEARVCSFCWGEPARLTHQKTSRPKRSIFCLFFVEFTDFFCCCYLGEALRAGVRGFTVDDFLLIPGFPP